MESYTTNVAQMRITCPVYMAYAWEGEPKIVTGGIEASLHVGTMGGSRHQMLENQPLPSFGILEAYRLWLPDYTGAQERLIFNGPVYMRIALVGNDDGMILTAAQEHLRNFISTLRGTESEGGVPNIFGSVDEANTYLSVPENLELAEKLARHYQQALSVEHKKIDVGFDAEGKPLKASQELIEQSKANQRHHSLPPPEAPAKINVQNGEARPDIK